MRFHKARLYRKSTAPQTASCRPRQHSQYLTAWLVREFFGATHSVACAAPKNEPFHVFETPWGVEFGKARRTGSNVAHKYKAAAEPCLNVLLHPFLTREKAWARAAWAHSYFLIRVQNKIDIGLTFCRLIYIILLSRQKSEVTQCRVKKWAVPHQKTPYLNAFIWE